MRYAFSHCTYEEKFENGVHTYVFTGPCFKTGKPYSVIVPAAGLFQYNQGAKIQDAFPHMSNEDREFLMSGYSPEGWNLIFGNKEDTEASIHNDSDDHHDHDISGDSTIISKR